MSQERFPRGRSAIVSSATYGIGEAPGLTSLDLAVRASVQAPGGELPVNTNGGGLSCVHPGMYGLFTMVEAAQQLAGNAGERQVPDAKLALAHGNGGELSSQATLVLGTAETI